MQKQSHLDKTKVPLIRYLDQILGSAPPPTFKKSVCKFIHLRVHDIPYLCLFFFIKIELSIK